MYLVGFLSKSLDAAGVGLGPLSLDEGRPLPRPRPRVLVALRVPPGEARDHGAPAREGARPAHDAAEPEHDSADGGEVRKMKTNVVLLPGLHGSTALFESFVALAPGVGAVHTGPSSDARRPGHRRPREDARGRGRESRRLRPRRGVVFGSDRGPARGATRREGGTPRALQPSRRAVRRPAGGPRGHGGELAGPAGVERRGHPRGRRPHARERRARGDPGAPEGDPRSAPRRGVHGDVGGARAVSRTAAPARSSARATGSSRTRERGPS